MTSILDKIKLRRLFDQPAKKPLEDLSAERFTKYRSALRVMMEGNGISKCDKNIIKMLRNKYNISRDEHIIIEAMINFENKMDK